MKNCRSCFVVGISIQCKIFGLGNGRKRVEKKQEEEDVIIFFVHRWMNSETMANLN